MQDFAIIFHVERYVSTETYKGDRKKNMDYIQIYTESDIQKLNEKFNLFFEKLVSKSSIESIITFLKKV